MELVRGVHIHRRFWPTTDNDDEVSIGGGSVDGPVDGVVDGSDDGPVDNDDCESLTDVLETLDYDERQQYRVFGRITQQAYDITVQACHEKISQETRLRSPPRHTQAMHPLLQRMVHRVNRRIKENFNAVRVMRFSRTPDQLRLFREHIQSLSKHGRVAHVVVGDGGVVRLSKSKEEDFLSVPMGSGDMVVLRSPWTDGRYVSVVRRRVEKPLYLCSFLRLPQRRVGFFKNKRCTPPLAS
jgi:hypothetical protein